MCTLCQSQLYLSQSLFQVMCLWCKTLQRGLGWFIVIQLHFQGQTRASITVCLYHSTHTNTTESRTHTHTHSYFAHSLMFFNIFFCLSSGWIWTQTLFTMRNRPSWQQVSLSNEIHADDVLHEYIHEWVRRTQEEKQDFYKWISQWRVKQQTAKPANK